VRGTTRPSDYSDHASERARTPSALATATVKHGDRFGSLKVEGVAFRDAIHRKLCVHARCTVCGTPRDIAVYHLVHVRTLRCRSCPSTGKRWNRAPACVPQKTSGDAIR